MRHHNNVTGIYPLRRISLLVNGVLEQVPHESLISEVKNEASVVHHYSRTTTVYALFPCHAWTYMCGVFSVSTKMWL